MSDQEFSEESLSLPSSLDIKMDKFNDDFFEEEIIDMSLQEFSSGQFENNSTINLINNRARCETIEEKESEYENSIRKDSISFYKQQEDLYSLDEQLITKRKNSSQISKDLLQNLKFTKRKNTFKEQLEYQKLLENQKPKVDINSFKKKVITSKNSKVKLKKSSKKILKKPSKKVISIKRKSNFKQQCSINQSQFSVFHDQNNSKKLNVSTSKKKYLTDKKKAQKKKISQNQILIQKIFRQKPNLKKQKKKLFDLKQEQKKQRKQIKLKIPKKHNKINLREEFKIKKEKEQKKISIEQVKLYLSWKIFQTYFNLQNQNQFEQNF